MCRPTLVSLVCGVLSSLGHAAKIHAIEAMKAQNQTQIFDLIDDTVPLYEELAASIPLVAINLTNYSGLINDKDLPKKNPNITYHFGNLTSDLALLSDKVSGFYMVLHDMLGEAGPKLCPLGKQSHLKDRHCSQPWSQGSWSLLKPQVSNT